MKSKKKLKLYWNLLLDRMSKGLKLFVDGYLYPHLTTKHKHDAAK